MKQSRLMSLVEAVANVVVGYGIAVLTQLAVFPWFGLPARVSDALALVPLPWWRGMSCLSTFASCCVMRSAVPLMRAVATARARRFRPA